MTFVKIQISWLFYCDLNLYFVNFGKFAPLNLSDVDIHK